ncbi:protein WVD2-like 5 [Pistacia vera]|uniref:protein WVD2-like 5 n=1 Tax=Pistacia vera TaxID=55513 RepID=UPI001262DF24|nr:protein WVD2-like 5 [Pistacia vera]
MSCLLRGLLEENLGLGYAVQEHRLVDESNLQWEQMLLPIDSPVGEDKSHGLQEDHVVLQISESSKKGKSNGGCGSKNGVEDEFILANPVEFSALETAEFEHQWVGIFLHRDKVNEIITSEQCFKLRPPLRKFDVDIPTTRAKSPKLRRKKTLTSVETDRNGNPNTRPGQLSLDGKASQSNSAKGISPLQSKKPQRKSLLKLPSERSNLNNSSKEEKMTSPKAANEENTTSLTATKEADSLIQESAPATGSEETQLGAEEEPVVGEQDEPTFVQEPMALEGQVH